MIKPIYYEQEEDPRIPAGYGIDESYGGSFYAYQWRGPQDWFLPCYFTNDQGFDQPYPTYEAALKAILRRAGRNTEMTYYDAHEARRVLIIYGLIKLYNRTYQHYLQVATHLAGIYRIGHNDPVVTGLEQQKHALEDRLDGILFRLSLVGCSPHDFTAYEQELLKKQGIYKHE